MDFLLNQVEDGRVELLSFLDPINDTEKRWLQETLSESPAATQETVVAVVSTSRRHGFAEKLDLEPGEISPELINFFIALIVIAVRYPSCFWNRNKGFGVLFSIHLFVTSVICLVLISCFTILYKVHINGPDRSLLRYPSRFSLNIYQTVILSVLMVLMMLISSNVLYYYGHQKYNEWRERQRRKNHHILGPGRSKLWGFFPHFLAFICLMLTAIPAIPMMYDLILVYCGSLDSASLIGASAIAFYLLEFIILWLFLTLKLTWDFSADANDEMEAKQELLREPFGPRTDASLKTAASRLLEKGDPPLLIIDHGQTIQVREASSKNAIRAAAQRSRVAQKAVSSLSIPDKTDEMAVYWLRPQAMTPPVEKKSSDDNTCNESKTSSWLRRKRNKSDSQVKRKNSLLRSGKKEKESVEDTFSDDGDYSTMRSLVHREDTDENMRETTFAPAEFNRDKNMNGDYELLVEQNDQPNSPFNQNNFNYEDIYGIRTLFNPVQSLRVQTARNEYLQGRVGSISSESSNSPEKSSDTSSGVHSGSSAAASITSDKRSASAENLMKSLCHQIHARPSFRSSSLQRHGMFPPAPIQVKCPKVNYSSSAHHPAQPDSPFTPCPEIPPPMNEINTMVIRRCKNRSATQEIHCLPSLFTRRTNMRMTSFAESSSPYDEGDDFANHPLPPPPPPHHLMSSDTSSQAEKPTASITPQLPPFPSFDSSHQVKQESSFEMEIARHFL